MIESKASKRVYGHGRDYHDIDTRPVTRTYTTSRPSDKPKVKKRKPAIFLSCPAPSVYAKSTPKE